MTLLSRRSNHGTTVCHGRLVLTQQDPMLKGMPTGTPHHGDVQALDLDVIGRGEFSGENGNGGELDLTESRGFHGSTIVTRDGQAYSLGLDAWQGKRGIGCVAIGARRLGEGFYAFQDGKVGTVG